MGKMKAYPRYNVISMRICADEHKILKQLCKKQNTNITAMMREALRQLMSQNNEPTLHCQQHNSN